MLFGGICIGFVLGVAFVELMLWLQGRGKDRKGFYARCLIDEFRALFRDKQ